jgi:hypothetical protein
MKTMYYVIGGIVGLLIVWALGSYLAVRSLEEPSYVVTEKRDGYEVRMYNPYIVAETVVNSSEYNRDLNQGFRAVAGYIFGDNIAAEKISMTTPVLEQPGDRSVKIAMTVPVLEDQSDNVTRTIAFVLPSKYSLTTLPTPNNDQVTLREVDGRKVAALRFTWYGTPDRVTAKKAQLLKKLQQDGFTVISEPQAAFYNPPLSMPLVLRNEILIEIE